jgi:hypothetical protein
MHPPIIFSPLLILPTVGTFWSQQYAKAAVAAPLRQHWLDRCGGPVRPVIGEIPAVDLRTSPGQDPVRETHVGLL